MSTDLTHHGEQPFSVLLVCTANICRSPLAEHLLRAALQAQGHQWTVTSAGLSGSDGRAMHPRSLLVLDQRGIPVNQWASHAIHRKAIETSDLILTATSNQASAVVGMVPTAIMRTFPLRKFARLVGQDGAAGRHAESGPALLHAANQARTRVATVNPSADDIRDPINRSRRFFRHRVEEIDAAVRQIVAALDVLPVGVPAAGPGQALPTA